MKKIIFSLLFILSASVFGQTFSVFNIDTTNFPTMKANFFTLDATGKGLMYLNSSDFEVKENGASKSGIVISCPAPKVERLSIVLVVDLSIYNDINNAKNVLNAWLDIIPLNINEIAIISYDGNSYINQDFSNNKDKLKKTINSLSTLSSSEDHTGALMRPTTGAIAVAKTGKYKPTVVFLSSCSHFDVNREKLIIDEAKKSNVTINFNIFDKYDWTASICRHIAIATGGFSNNYIPYNDLKTAISSIQIILAVNSTKPCSIEWESEVACSDNATNLSIKLLPLNLIQNAKYTPPFVKIEELERSPINPIFYNSIPGIKRDTIITLTARNRDVRVTNITSSNPAFSFDKTNFLIPKNRSVDLKISLIPKDSEYVFSRILFETETCPYEMQAVSFFKGRTNKINTLKLTKPNGGEEFLVGSNNDIIWEGIPTTDLVSLDYSIDAGKNWKAITNITSGLKYNWRSTPPPPSGNCLVRVVQKHTDKIPLIQMQKCLGGRNDDYANAIQQTKDGGLIIVGGSNSNDGDVKGNKGQTDVWVVKLNLSGIVEWQKCYGGSSTDVGTSIQQTSDGGYILAGNSESINGDVGGNKGFADIWILKLNTKGDIEWKKTLGGSDRDNSSSIRQTTDGGYILAGNSKSKDKDLNGNYGDYDILVIKLNSTGVVDWQKRFGGTATDYANAIQQTSDGGFIVAGETFSNDVDVSGNHGGYDAWAIKISSLGDLEWQKCLGGTGWDYVTAIQQTFDDGFIAAGYTYSTDGYVKGNHGATDAWVIKLNSLGEFEWQKCLGGSGYDQATSVQQTFDAGYIVAGFINSLGGSLSDSHGKDDVLIVKLKPTGEIDWQQYLGGSYNDRATSIQQTLDGGFVMAGYTESTDGDVSDNRGFEDAWIVKLSPDLVDLQSDISDAVFSIVAPKASAIGVDMGKCIVGDTKDSVVIKFIQNIGSYKCRIDSIFIQGADAGAFRLIGGFPKYEIDKAASHFAEFNFKPSRIGIHNAEIVVVTQSDTFIQKINGTGVAPQLQVLANVYDFGSVDLGKDRIMNDTIVIKNIGSSSIDITKIVKMSPDLEQFDIISGGNPVVLNSGETHKMTLRFKPKFGGRTSGRIGFEYCGTGSPVTATLFGTGIGGVVVSSSDSAYSGEKKNIHITLKNIKPAGLQAMATSFSANLKFQGRILAPQDFSQVLSFKNDSITMRVSGDLPNDSTILSIPMIAGLGNVEETTIEISDFKLYDNSGALIDYDMEVEYGTFKVLGICREGGTRLMNPNSQAQILSVRPNPATNAINIAYQLTEKGGAEFLLINDLGETVKQISYAEISDFTQRLETIKLDDLANGRYTLILKTPTISERRSVVVVR